MFSDIGYYVTEYAAVFAWYVSVRAYNCDTCRHQQEHDGLRQRDRRGERRLSQSDRGRSIHIR